MTSLLLGYDRIVAQCVVDQLAHIETIHDLEPFTAIGVVTDSGTLIGGFVFNNYRGHDVQVTVAFKSPVWARPHIMRGLADYIFNQMGCVRVTAVTAKKNKRARKSLEHGGWKQEGVLRKGFDGRQAAVVYGMTRDDCRWIK